MSDEEFMELVDAGIDALGEDIRARMDNVAIVVADAPLPHPAEDAEKYWPSMDTPSGRNNGIDGSELTQ